MASDVAACDEPLFFPAGASGQHMQQVIYMDPLEPLANQVQAAFQRLGYRQLRALRCRTEGSTVVLNGTISSFYLKQIAQSTAAKVEGVQRVVNEIEVTA